MEVSMYCASVYRCKCMEVYMYVRVFRSVYVCARVYRCICMEVYMYVRVFIGMGVTTILWGGRVIL